MAKVDELDKAIAVAAKDPARYSLDETELGKRRKWTSTARKQACICVLVLFLWWLQLTITSFLSYFYMAKAFSVGTIRRTLEESGAKGSSVTPSLNGVRQELMRLPNDYASMAGRSGYNNTSRDDDDFISSESDRQLLLIK
ncbi:hypothetical protein GW17_00023917 [Ensete ventricosum]|nr:hypothetical protein GW17_00023917 [Ensete ventricosum]RZS24039.1 hypothetical protein BHM03_00057060 [Ensete ventricosum]